MLDPLISNTGYGNVRVVAVGCDTLALTYRVSGYAEWISRRIREFQEAKLASQDGGVVDVGIGDWRLRMEPFGAPHYSFRLACDSFSVFLSSRDFGVYPPLMVWGKSESLWNVGAAGLVKVARSFVEQGIGKILEEKVSRVDLTFDFSGWEPTFEDVRRIVSRAVNRSLFWVGERLAGVSLGAGHRLYARLYDKTLEILRSGKRWMHQVWAEGGWDGLGSVWRLEFECKRDFLREFQVEGFDDFVSAYPDICDYLFGDWVRLETEEGGVHPVWLQLNAAVRGDRVGLVRGIRTRRVAKERYVYGILGYLTSYAAAVGILEMDRAWEAVAVEMKRYLNRKGETFEGRVLRKRYPGALAEMGKKGPFI